MHGWRFPPHFSPLLFLMDQLDENWVTNEIQLGHVVTSIWCHFRIQLGSRSGDWVIIRFRLGHINIYIQIILVNSTFDNGNTRKVTDESITMAKTRRTPRPQKSPAKAKAAVNKMKGAATTAPRSPDEPDEPDVPEEAESKVGIESVVWDHPEAVQKIKADEISVDDGTTGIQSVLEAAAAAVALSGATRKNSAPAVGAKKPNAKKPSPSKRKTLAQKPVPPQ
jgi:hypothetical protein